MMIDMELVTDEIDESNEGRHSMLFSVSSAVVGESKGVDGVVVALRALKSWTMCETSLLTISREASSRANRLEAGTGSIRPDAGAGVAIEMIPLMRSATTLCTSFECWGDNMLTSLGMNSCDESHYSFGQTMEVCQSCTGIPQ